MKKILALVMVLCLACGCAMAEADINTIAGRNQAIGFPVVDEPVDVTILVVPQDAAIDFKAEDNWMCQYITRYSGLNITWQVVDRASSEERVTLLLNSGSMPDCILGYDFGTSAVVQYGVSEQMFRPINDLLEYCPNFSALLEERPEVKREITATDGNIYGFPALSNVWSTSNRIFIRESWLNNVGMENPKTLEEFKAVLTAFRDQDANGNGDPNDEIPWDGSWNEMFSERNVILNAFGYMNSDNIAVDYNGDETKLVYVGYAEKYKDYLLFMNELWNENLMSADMFTQAESQVQADVLEGVVGVCTQSSPMVYDVDNSDDWRVLNPMTDGQRETPLYPAPFAIYSAPVKMAINADCDEEVAVALAKLADVMYSLEWYSMAKNGPEYGSEMDWNNYGHYINEKGSLSSKYPESMPSGWAHLCTNLSIYALPGYNLEGYDPYIIEYAEKYPDTTYGEYYKNGPKYNPWNMELNEVCSPYYVEKVPGFFYSVEDMTRINELIVPLDDYVASMEAKFITGEVSIEGEYENFLKTLESYGVQELMEIYNRYYEAYKAN